MMPPRVPRSTAYAGTRASPSYGSCPVRQIRASDMGEEVGTYLAGGFEIEAAADGWVLLLHKNGRWLVLQTWPP